MKTSRGNTSKVTSSSPSDRPLDLGEWSWNYRTLLALRDHLTGCSGDRERESRQAMEPPSLHAEDLADDVYDRELASALPAQRALALREVEDALLRIREGNYGRCEETGRRIPAALLRSQPWRRTRNA